MANEFSLPARGFTFPLGGKDVFVITKSKNKTEGLARKILRKMLLPENPDTVKEILYYLQRAELDIKEIHCDGIVPFRYMWEIHGHGFGGKGSFIDDGNTIVICL